MILRAVSLLLALTTGLLCASYDAQAQPRWPNAGGFARGPAANVGGATFARPPGRAAGARPGFAVPPFGYGGDPAYGRNGYTSPRAYGRDAYARPSTGYARQPFSGGAEPAYGLPPYGSPAYPPRAYAPAYPPPGYGSSFGGNWRQEQNEVRQAVRDGRHIPLGQAIEAVRRRSPGHELDADLVQGADGRSAYRLRWAASNGRRIDYLVDAATGAIVGVEGAR